MQLSDETKAFIRDSTANYGKVRGAAGGGAVGGAVLAQWMGQYGGGGGGGEVMGFALLCVRRRAGGQCCPCLAQGLHRTGAR